MKKLLVLGLLAIMALAVGAETLKVTADTWVYQFRPNKNYGDGFGWLDITNPDDPTSMPRLFLGFGGEDKKLVLLKFDTSKLNRPVKKATLMVFNDFAGSDAALMVDAKAIKANWIEKKATWNNRPQLSDEPLCTTQLKGSIGLKGKGKWYKWNVTKLVQDWQKGGANNGVALDPQGDSGVDFQVICKESKGHDAHFPKIDVEY
jgi:hypothetical protein